MYDDPLVKATRGQGGARGQLEFRAEKRSNVKRPLMLVLLVLFAMMACELSLLAWCGHFLVGAGWVVEDANAVRSVRDKLKVQGFIRGKSSKYLSSYPSPAHLLPLPIGT